MQFDFLKGFTKRMKHVGLYSLLIANNWRKGTWKECGFSEEDEQINLDFAVMLYIMENSLRDMPCTIDEIAVFIDDLNATYFRKDLSHEQCHLLADLIVNTVLSRDGEMMHFSGYDFEQSGVRQIPISYVENRILDPDSDNARVAYSLTEDGYSLLLGTLEVENNMKLSVQEMIFRMHMERQNYDQALEDIKNIFNLMHIQLQKNREAMQRIRANVLSYSAEEYNVLLHENLDTISETNNKFKNYREHVKNRRLEIERSNINVHALSREDLESIENLRKIETYLSRTIDEHQHILMIHMDVQEAYGTELERIRELAMIQRFSLKSEIYDLILKKPEALLQFHRFLAPLLLRDPEKTLNLNRMFLPQQQRLDSDQSTEEEVLDFDEDSWAEEQERLRKEKMTRYYESIEALLSLLTEKGSMSLEDVKAHTDSDQEFRHRFAPSVEVLREVFVELVRFSTFDLPALRVEQRERLSDDLSDFAPVRILLSVLDAHPEWTLTTLDIEKRPKMPPVLFEHIPDAYGNFKSVRCSNVLFILNQQRVGKGDSHEH